jgi:uncharacterized protein YegJ (DUF2314 family)
MFERGDYVKVEFKDETSGENEWMWVRVMQADDGKRLVFGTLDSEPVVMTDLRLGMELAVSYDNIREHMKPSSSGQ